MSDRGYPLLLGGTASWFGFWGAHAVVYQWLLAERLGVTPGQMGTAQMAITLPSLLFLLVGGATADRLDPRRLIVGIHVATGVTVAALGVGLAVFELHYSTLVAYAALVGTLQAFAFPARDTLLSHVVRGPMSRAVVGTTLTQHSLQATGSFLAGSAGVLGAVPVVGGLALLVTAGAAPLSRLPRLERNAHDHPPSLDELRAGVLEVTRSPVLRPVLLLAIATGVLFVGPYVVLLPLLVRDVYHGGAAQMAVLTAMFPLGSVLGGLAIIWRGGLRRTGRALVLGQLFATACIAAVASDLPFGGTVAAVLGWGLAGALFINAGRTLFQTHASEAHRARVLSVYTLGVMGGAPLGSVLAGAVATPLGLHATFALDAAVAFAIAVTIATTTGLWRAEEPVTREALLERPPPPLDQG